MHKVVKLAVAALLCALAFSSCKSSCDCFKHSYGQNAVHSVSDKA